MSNTKISILMPSLNVGKFITECIESVLAQTMKEIEIICIDAGSTDGTVEVLMDHAKGDKRIKIINSPIKSYGYQMNLGIDAASGEYIGIVETDDYVPKDMFEKLYNYVSDNKADFVKSRYTEFGGNGENKKFHYVGKPLIDSISGQIIDLDKHTELRLCDVNHIWSGLYKKSFLKENNIRFNETPGASFQDTSFSVLVGSLAHTCIYISDSYYFYRIDNSGSSVKQSSKIRCIVDEFEYITSILKDRELFSGELKKAVLDLKLFLYTWNYNRLTDEARSKFIDIISKEIKSYKNEFPDYCKDTTISNEISLLSDKGMIAKVSAEYTRISDTMSKLSENIRNGIKYNIAGAGTYGKYILNIQKTFGLDFIDTIADNSDSIIGKEIAGYTVSSISIAAENSDSHWIIAVKNNADEIKAQLISLGISEEKILWINKQLSFSMLFGYLG